MAQWVKEPALALPWLRALLWHALDPLAWELPHATGSAKKKKKKKKKNLFKVIWYLQSRRPWLFNVTGP